MLVPSNYLKKSISLCSHPPIPRLGQRIKITWADILGAEEMTHSLSRCLPTIAAWSAVMASVAGMIPALANISEDIHLRVQLFLFLASKEKKFFIWFDELQKIKLQ